MFLDFLIDINSKKLTQMIKYNIDSEKILRQNQKLDKLVSKKMNLILTKVRGLN
ncbi:MAG: hypothetical protein HFJ53_01685 [Clostridia bacterium]|jgi:hypothetical protein|nr:hypothetical protein [Clostridia bacterium]